MSVSGWRRRSSIVAAVAVFGLTGSACAKPGAALDKAGGDVRVLHMAVIDVLNPNGQQVGPGVFVDSLKKISGGKLVVDLKTSFEDGQSSAESDLVKAIAGGALDGGWPASRSFAEAGIHGLEPIEAPMTITSYAAESAVATGAAGQALLASLTGSGLVGLGIGVGPLRHPWSNTKPLLAPADWKGLTFRNYNSALQNKVLAALGAVPVSASYNFPDLVAAGQMHGVETDIPQYWQNDYATLMPWATRNVILWPRMEIYSLNQKTFDSLTSQQRTWVQQAVDQAVQADVSFAHDDTTPALALCKQGVHFVDASASDLAAMRHALQPVYDGLARDPVTGPLFAMIQTVASEHPAADVPDVPASCRTP